MTRDEFSTSYRLLKCLTDVGVRSYHAVETASGDVVMVHLMNSNDTETVFAVTVLLDGLPLGQSRILLRDVLDGHPFVVTNVLHGFTTLQAWLAASVLQRPTGLLPEPALIAPAGGPPQPSEIVAESVAPPKQTELTPAKPTPVLAQEVAKPDATSPVLAQELATPDATSPVLVELVAKPNLPSPATELFGRAIDDLGAGSPSAPTGSTSSAQGRATQTSRNVSTNLSGTEIFGKAFDDTPATTSASAPKAEGRTIPPANLPESSSETVLFGDKQKSVGKGGDTQPSPLTPEPQSPTVRSGVQPPFVIPRMEERQFDLRNALGGANATGATGAADPYPMLLNQEARSTRGSDTDLARAGEGYNQQKPSREIPDQKVSDGPLLRTDALAPDSRQSATDPKQMQPATVPASRASLARPMDSTYLSVVGGGSAGASPVSLPKPAPPKPAAPVQASGRKLAPLIFALSAATIVAIGAVLLILRR